MSNDIKGIISGIKRMEIHDGDGLRTTIFFKGCPLRCLWCHNPESIGFKPQPAVFSARCVRCGSCAAVCPTGALKVGERSAVRDASVCTGCLKCANACPTGAIVGYGTEYSVDELFEKVMSDEMFFRNGNGGVTLSGGECLAQPEFAVALAKKFREHCVDVDIDTCGNVERGTLEQIIPYTDTFLYDIKAVDPEVHRRCTGRGNSLILGNLQYLSERGCRIEIRYPLVVGYNDGECEKIAGLLSGMRGITGVKVLKYHNLAASRYAALGMPDTLPEALTTDKDVENAREVFRAHGMRTPD